MAKILAKIQRRNNGNELPDRRELVEMDLFDTERNPWPGAIGNSLWDRHDYDAAVPFDPGVNTTSVGEEIVSADLVVERTSFAVCFLGAVFDAGPGGIDGTGDQHVGFSMQADNTTIANSVAMSTEEGIVSAGADFRTLGYNAFGYAVLNPATYAVKVFAWKDAADMPVHVTAFAATIALLPAGLASLGMGWGGTGG